MWFGAGVVSGAWDGMLISVQSGVLAAMLAVPDSEG